MMGLALWLSALLLSRFDALQRPDVSQLLTAPFLQLPTPSSVRVVWFTEFPGTRHMVEYGENFEQVAIANTTKLSRVQEDHKSRVGAQVEDGMVYQQPTPRDIWRHEAEVVGLQPNLRVPYRVTSTGENGRTVTSGKFSLTPAPPMGTPTKILLTSDHQLMPMTPTNLQKVVETIGQVDAVFLAGDLVNIPDRASEWFDDNRGGAFFPSLQGRANYKLERNGSVTAYRGGAIIQYAPLFPATGNHEVMGRTTAPDLNEQFNDPYPQAAAVQLYDRIAGQVNPTNDPTIRSQWLKDNSFNSDTYEEIFSLPNDSPGGKKYYAVTFGDVRLISLYVTNIWRSPELNPDTRGRYQERSADFKDPSRWGYGQHIFEAITPGSAQYTWLQAELKRPEFQQAKYKIVMFHHPPHSLGDNIVPAYTNPRQKLETDAQGQVTAIRYEYPLANDYLIRDVIPLLESAGVQLVLYGHSHLWNRFTNSTRMHFLETSNVGNTYGAFTGDKQRPIPPGFTDYAATGDPNGLEPVIPTIRPLLNPAGRPQPYIASNDMTVFTLLDTATGMVSSYRFDTRRPNSRAFKFDEFRLGRVPRE
jgi:hypothetical protein